MPKEPETRDRFRITFEVGMVEAGEVIASLTRMGAQNLNFELITDILRYKNKRTGHDVGHRDFLLHKIGSKAAFTSKEATAWFREDGRHPKSLASLLSNLCKEKTLNKTGVGKYAKGPKFQKPAPSKLNGAAKQEEQVTNV